MDKITQIRNLVERLNRYRDEYYNQDSPSVSDAVYDRLFDELKRLEEETGFVLSNSPTQTVGYPVVSGLPPAYHEIPLLSLDKTKEVSKLLEFYNVRKVNLALKLDGLTTEIIYEGGRLKRLSTRGDGEEGDNITHNAAAIFGIPMQIPYSARLVVVGESYILRSDFERLKKTVRDSKGKPYKNGRNLAAGSVRAFDAATCAKRCVRFTAFSVIDGLKEVEAETDSKLAKLTKLKGFGFDTVHTIQFTTADEETLASRIEELKNKAEEEDIPIDGMVITYDSVSFSKTCGRTGHHFKDGISFKFEDDLYETTLTDVEWFTSRTGVIAPVAIFEPTEIDGCEVTRASLHNVSFIKKHKLGIGDRICVSKRNMIIPQVETCIDESDTLQIPAVCPRCGKPTRIVDGKKEGTKMLFCDNAECPAKHVRRFVHFASKKAMDIEGISETILEQFVGRGWLNTYADLYHLDEHREEIIAMDGFGRRKFDRLWNAINESRKCDFVHFLCAMDIPMIGSHASRDLSKLFDGNIDKLMEAVDGGYDFTALPNFGETLNSNIHNWFSKPENRMILTEMKKEVEFMENKNVSVNNDNVFAGKTVVVTGTLVNFTRDTINSKLISLGATAGSSVSKKTDYLIVGEKAGSKLTKAQSLGVPVLTEAQFLEMIGE